MIAHIFACIWHLIGVASDKNDQNNWIDYYKLNNEDWHKKYLTSLYFVCVTMNTVGYGDILPKNDYEKLYSIFFIYIGCGLFAYSMNVIGTIV